MSWFIWALLSAFFAGLTAVLAKVGLAGVNSNLATAIRTVVILIFAWLVAFLTNAGPISKLSRVPGSFLSSPALPPACLGYAISARCSSAKLRASLP